MTTDYKHLNRALREHMKEIEDIIDLFGDDIIHTIQLDLALTKTQNFYDVLLMLKSVYEKSNNKAMQEKTIQINEIIDEEESEIKEGKLKSKKEKDESENKQTDETEKDKKILSDRFKTQRESIHDSIIKKSKNFSEISSKISLKPVTDIVSSLGINEKFQIVNQLFKGNMDNFNKAMDFLNNATDFNQAYNYLTENYGWNMDNDLVQHILDLIRRKLIVNKNE